MLRAGWLALVVAIVAAGVTTVSIPHEPRPTTDALLPADLQGVAVEYCFLTSGAAAYGNLLVSVDLREHRIHAAVSLQQPDAAPLAGHGQAGPLQRSAVVARLNRCLRPYRFESTSPVVAAGAPSIRQYQYDIGVLWPCLRAHRVDPGAAPTPSSAGPSRATEALAAAALEGDRPLREILRIAAECPPAPVPAGPAPGP